MKEKCNKKTAKRKMFKVANEKSFFFFLKIGKSINPFVVKKKNKQIHVYLDF